MCGCLRLVTATQTTMIPTQMTMTVAAAGTMTSRLSQSGSPGTAPPLVRSALSSASESGPPKAGPTRSAKVNRRANGGEQRITWFESGRRSGHGPAAEDANDGDCDHDDGDGGHHGNNEVDVGQKVLEGVLQLGVAITARICNVPATVPWDTPGRSYRTYRGENKTKKVSGVSYCKGIPPAEKKLQGEHFQI